MRLLPHLLAMAALISFVKGQGAELHSILVDVPINNLWLAREEMALTPPPVRGQKPVPFSTNGKPRDVIYQGSASLDGNPLLTLGTAANGKSPSAADKDARGITIRAELVGTLPAATLAYDVSMLLAAPDGHSHRFETSGTCVPAHVNRWQEVASWTHDFRTVMLWQYVSAPPAETINTTPPGSDKDLMLDVVIATLPAETVTRAATFTADEARTCVDYTYSASNAPWKYHGLICQPGRAFSTTSSASAPSRSAKTNHPPAATGELDGTFTGAAPGKHRITATWKASYDLQGNPREYPISAELITGEWKLIPLEDGPRILWPTLPTSTTGADFPSGPTRVNTIAIRLRDPAER